MLKLIFFILSIPADKVPAGFSRIVITDMLTIGTGFVIMLSSFADQGHHQDAVTIGASLFILGILIRVWRKDINRP